MLSVDLKVNKDIIITIQIRNIGVEESYRRGLIKSKRYYVYEAKRKACFGTEGVWGEVIHDREDGPLVLLKKVIDDIGCRNLLDHFLENKLNATTRAFWGLDSIPLLRINSICES